MKDKAIYLDHNATTPIDPEVLEAMRPYLSEKFGNASSASHVYGWEAQAAVKLARASIAEHFGVSPDEIVFTSGATESNNLAIKGAVLGSGVKPNHVITQITEHKCILESCRFLEKLGHEVTYLSVNAEGMVDPSELKKSIRSNTVLCSVMAANNEIGTLQPLKEISQICQSAGLLFHTDAVQAIGLAHLPSVKGNISMMSLSAHKIYGPKGIGALIVSRKKSFTLEPQIHGGGHENGLRSGTLNVSGIVGLAKAVEMAFAKQSSEISRLTELRDCFIDRVLKELDHVHVNGSRTERLPHNVSLTILYLKAEDLIRALPDLAFSTGSACTGYAWSSSSVETSHVIRALGKSEDEARSTIRFGLGRSTTRAQIDYAVDKLVETVKKLRSTSLEYQMAMEKAGARG